VLGTKLERAGWRQGSLVREQDAAQLVEILNLTLSEKCILAVASQSCDIAHNDLNAEPSIELLVGQVVDSPNGNFNHGKNPRVLEVSMTIATMDESIAGTQPVRFLAKDRYSVDKSHFTDIAPDENREFRRGALRAFITWLASRYQRSALPTEFNVRVDASDPKNKRRNKAKKADKELLGIYVEIFPDKEIEAHESYSVNLLGLLGSSGGRSKAENAIKAYADVFKAAGMDVKYFLAGEDEISLAVIKRFKKLYLDDLSLGSNESIGPEP
jgi:hypothetical protein